MKRKNTFIIFSVFTMFILFSFAAHAAAPVMSDYTAYPPFVDTGTTPNLLLMIDNSGSMYDISYVDEGNLPTRDANYCYDQTYISTTTYAGYFEENSVYTYNFTDNRFETGAFTIACSNEISGELCLNIVTGPPNSVNEFTVRGNYLNWMSASKLDIQKEILTGGKYDTLTNEFISESRGCIGRRYIKEALTADYVEGGVNTSLGVSFAINGPTNSLNLTAPSPGGQTSIEIFEGNYNEGLCQAAVEAIVYASNPASIRKTVEDCLSYDPNAAGTQYCLLAPATSCTVDSDCDIGVVAGTCSTGKKSARTCLTPASMFGDSCINDSDCDDPAGSVGPCVGGTTHSADVNTKIVFNQSIQECWQIWSGSKTEVGYDAWAAEAPKCAEVYAGYKVCNGGSNDGNTCTTAAECPGGGTCDGGPSALTAGNPALMCSKSYAGYCATTGDNWATTTWVNADPTTYTDAEDCFRKKYLEYCGDMNVPQVIDPSDTPDDPAETANIPAIIADIGIEAQLGDPIMDITANRYDKTVPTGLLDDFSDSIRFGAMSFNFDGSDSECNLSPTDDLECPKVCSITTSTTCSTDLDCPSGETCNAATTSKDGGEIIHYIGTGNCSVTTATSCIRDDQCPATESCVATVGDHDTGLIKAIDDIEANTWTPFAESYYNAIAYFVKDATGNPTLDIAQFTPTANAISTPLNSDDFAANNNPIEYSCQKNSILIISDGAPTADLNTTMTGKTTQLLYNDQLADDSASCGNYLGGTYLDDLSYYANNKNIFNPDDVDTSDDESAQKITTYVVYTGTETSTETGECVPKTLMENTAVNGGTTLYNAQDASTLAASLESAFQEVASEAAAGTAVSVLSTTGEGDGAIYQAYFYPQILEGSEPRKWLGFIHALFIDKYGNLREDTNNDDALDITTDLILEMQYTAATGTTVNRFLDANGDYEKDSVIPVSTVALEDINTIWKGGETLWQTAPSNRALFTSIDGYNSIDFTATNASTLKPYLRAADNTESGNIINWVLGDDLTGTTDASHADGYRKRSITIGGSTNVWKLGDIVYSTPTTVGRPMENYDLLYGDADYSDYRKKHIKRRQVVYTGANDGMLHAFNAGCFDETNHKYFPDVDSSGNCVSSGRILGEELWAFVPRGLLPHLMWNTLPTYTHVYHVDLKPKIVDAPFFTASTNHVNGWGTILIGGFRYGGKDISWTSGATSYSASPEYFALDITDPLNPRLLWTFSDPDLGLSMSTPAGVKVDTKGFAIFGSGATDFNSDSDLTTYQDGYLYILDISSGTNGVISSWVEGTNFWKIKTGNINAFLSDPVSVDVDIDYNVDVMYFGENYNDGTGWNAILHRLTTNGGSQTDPSLWTLSTLGNINTIAGANDTAKRITSSPSVAMDNYANLWTFFGSGQFLGTADKNLTETGAFYAIKDTCWDGTCSSSYTNLMDISGITVKTDGTVSGLSGCGSGITSWDSLLTSSTGCEGWSMYFKNVGESIDFAGDALNHTGERMLTKPLVLGGLVTWATYIPGLDECSAEGESNVYAVYYKTGSAYTEYVFKDQKEQITPSLEVARIRKLGVGLPSSLSAQITAGGTAKGFVQQSTGSILEIESVTPIGLKSGVSGWKSEEIQ